MIFPFGLLMTKLNISFPGVSSNSFIYATIGELVLSHLLESFCNR